MYPVFVPLLWKICSFPSPCACRPSIAAPFYKETLKMWQFCHVVYTSGHWWWKGHLRPPISFPLTLLYFVSLSFLSAFILKSTSSKSMHLNLYWSPWFYDLYGPGVKEASGLQLCPCDSSSFQPLKTKKDKLFIITPFLFIMLFLFYFIF